MFTSEQQAQIATLLAEAKQVPNQVGLLEGHVWDRRLSDDETHLLERYFADRHGIYLPPERVEIPRGVERRLLRMFRKAAERG